ncbi:sodium/potassium/calcium exchanger 6-like [Tropilaelaps mercedesae]|uniref:Sodium/potassium/calcium exchanger 6-like n=1 Tax=Tropilaelaps mercedesae TaxID=418985 RepID=A0A1V9XL39_9ACAR|nr:sodium/potassium/calcium exchanger 6-like [Tropilaelaps mercedesae]
MAQIESASDWNSSGSCSHVTGGCSSTCEFIKCFPLAPHLPLIVLSFFTSLLFYMLAVTADGYLCPAAIHIAKKLGLSDPVAGATLVAFGNGAPNVFSALSGVRQGRSSMMITQLFGSGVFVTAVVTGLVMIVVPPFTVDWASFSRDTAFYLSGSIFTFYVFYRSKVNLMHAVAFILTYVVYIAVVGAFSSYWASANDVIGKDEALLAETDSMYSYTSAKTALTSSMEFIHKMRKNLESAVLPASNSTLGDSTYGTFADGSALFDSGRFTDEGSAHFVIAELLFHVMPWSLKQFKAMKWHSKLKSLITLPIHLLLSLTVPIVDDKEYKANWCRILNVVHCVVTPTVVLCLYGINYNVYGISLATFVLAVSFVLGVALFYRSKSDRPPRYHHLLAMLGFVASTAWIFRICEVIVSTITTIGTALGVPESMLGLTVLSWGNSIGDLVMDVSIARQGFASMAISAAFGAILVDMLLGLGISYLINVAQEDNWTLAMDWSFTVLPVFVGLILLLVVAPSLLWANGWRSTKAQGAILIGIYVATATISVIVSVAEAKGFLKT